MNSKIALVAVPEFVTAALPPDALVVVAPIVMLAAEPSAPSAPGLPCGPCGPAGIPSTVEFSVLIASMTRNLIGVRKVENRHQYTSW